MYASYFGREAVVEYLLTHGCNVKCAAATGRTALHLCTAIWGGSIPYGGSFDVAARIAALLVPKGAQLNARDICGETPLWVAVERGNRPLAQYLIQHGADIEATAYGRTPLLVAARAGHISMTKMLTDYRANVNVVDGDDGNSPLIWATLHGQDLFSLLYRGCNVNHANKVGYTALHYAAEERNIFIAHTLLQHGAKLDVRTKRGELPTDLGTPHFANSIRIEENRLREAKVAKAKVETSKAEAAAEAAALLAAVTADASDDDDDDDDDDERGDLLRLASMKKYTSK
jgi:ankyrin repeat protein